MSSPSKEIHTLPDLIWEPTTAWSSRNGVKPTLVVVHRWDGGSFGSVIRMFKDSPHGPTGKSATFVYAGERGPDAGKLAQMIGIGQKPWTQETWNPHCVSIECADAIFSGDDPVGFMRLGRLIAGLCHYLNVPAKWVTANLLNAPNGYTRHHDLGVLGGNHPQCPTTDMAKWMHLVGYVQREADLGGFQSRSHWGLR